MSDAVRLRWISLDGELTVPAVVDSREYCTFAVLVRRGKVMADRFVDSYKARIDLSTCSCSRRARGPRLTISIRSLESSILRGRQ